MDGQRILLCPHPRTGCLPRSRFGLEIVGTTVPIMNLHLTSFCSSYRRTYRPLPYHIAQELQKYNIPDYRPRQEQYVAMAFHPTERVSN